MSHQLTQDFVRHMATYLELQISNGGLSDLQQFVHANDEHLVAVDSAARTSAEDPLAFNRYLDTWDLTNDD